MKKCFVETHYGRNTPCHFGCTDVCKRFLGNRDRGGPFFLPTRLPSLAAWYRRGVGITSSLGAVSVWADQVSGGAKNWVQATGTNQPTLTAHNTVLCDGVDNFLTSTFVLEQPFTVYGLVNTVTWTDTERVISGTASFINQSVSTPTVRFNAGSSGGNIAPVLNTVNVITCVGNGAASSTRLNEGAANVFDAGTGAFTNPTLAARNDGVALFANTDNYEWVFYSAAHDEATQLTVISYLMAVGGL